MTWMAPFVQRLPEVAAIVGVAAGGAGAALTWIQGGVGLISGLVVGVGAVVSAGIWLYKRGGESAGRRAEMETLTMELRGLSEQLTRDREERARKEERDRQDRRALYQALNDISQRVAKLEGMAGAQQ